MGRRGKPFSGQEITKQIQKLRRCNFIIFSDNCSLIQATAQIQVDFVYKKEKLEQHLLKLHRGKCDHCIWFDLINRWQDGKIIHYSIKFMASEKPALSSVRKMNQINGRMKKKWENSSLIMPKLSALFF